MKANDRAMVDHELDDLRSQLLQVRGESGANFLLSATSSPVKLQTVEPALAMAATRRIGLLGYSESHPRR